MDEALKAYCDLLAQNRITVSKALGWEPDMLQAACAAVLADEGVTAKEEKLKLCRDILHREERFYSEFRGRLRLTVLAKMSMSDDPRVYLQQLRTISRLITGNTFFSGEHRILASIQILEQVGLTRAEETVERTYAIYRRMRKEHPWLTGVENFPMAAVLAVRRTNPEVLFAEMGECYRILREKFHAGDSAQICSHVLALSSTGAEQKCRKLFDIWDGLKAEKHRYGTGKELGLLAALTTLEKPTEEIVRDIIAADDYLRTKKGFGLFGIGTVQRRMYAAQAVLQVFAQKGSTVKPSLISCSIALSIAQAVSTLVISTTTASVTASHTT